jgi:hypothetical protein
MCGSVRSGIILIARARPQHVDLGGNMARDAAATGLAAFLAQNTAVQMLSLAGCGLTDESCRALCDALKANSALTVLDLSGNQLTNDAALMVRRRSTIYLYTNRQSPHRSLQQAFACH